MGSISICRPNVCTTRMIVFRMTPPCLVLPPPPPRVIIPEPVPDQQWVNPYCINYISVTSSGQRSLTTTALFTECISCHSYENGWKLSCANIYTHTRTRTHTHRQTDRQTEQVIRDSLISFQYSSGSAILNSTQIPLG